MRWVTAIQAVCFKGASFKSCKFPKAWLIEDEHQRWLFDTGYATHFMIIRAMALCGYIEPLPQCISKAKRPCQSIE